MEFLIQPKRAKESQLEIEEKIVSSGTDDQGSNEKVSHSQKKKYKSHKKKTKCTFCKQNVINFHRHLIRKHKSEKEVQEIEKHPRKSKKRKKLISLLRYEEHFQEYMRGRIIPSHERSVCDPQGYLPCAYCKAVFSRKTLARHSRHCEANDSKASRHLAASQTLIARSSEFGEALTGLRVTTEVFPIMKADDVSITAKTDPLIVYLGENYLTQRAVSPTVLTCCSNKMREVARLLNTFREKNSSRCTLSDTLDPVVFNHVMDSVKILGGYDEERQACTLPSLPVHLRASLKQACQICVDLLLRKSPHVKCASRKKKIKDVKVFQSLVESQWSAQVCDVAFTDVGNSKNVTFLSLVREVLKFREHALRLVQQSRSALAREANDADAYKTLVQITLALIWLTNRRRVSDVQFLRSDEYLEASEEEERHQSDSERIVTRGYKRVTVKSKENERGKVVLLAPVVQECIGTLREVTNRGEATDYVFALPGKRLLPKGETVIRQISIAGGICKDTMLAGRLRKHIVTIMRLLMLSEDDTRELLKFIGYSESFPYVPAEDLHQTARVAQFLNTTDKEHTRFSVVDFHPEAECVGSESDDESNETEEEQEEGAVSETSEGFVKSKKAKLGRASWSEEEKQAVMEHFAEHISGKIPPKKNETILFKLKHPNLYHDKDWVKIKAFVYNQYRMK